jgi:DNA-binding IclR family transcriptional regulator
VADASVAGANGGGVAVVRNALAILKAFSFETPVIGVSEFSRKLGLPKSTVSRLAKTLAAEGFLTPVTGGYRLALKLHELGALVVSGVELREIAHGKLVQLRNVTGETVHLAVLDDSEVVYLDRIESPNTLHVFTRIGMRMPAHSTSSGKAILAFSPPAAVDAVVAKGLPRLTPRTIDTRSALERALEVIRTNGWAASVDESEPGLNSLAAPIFDYTSQVVAAISVAGPAERLNATAMLRIAQHLKEATGQISREMGYRPMQRSAVRAVATSRTSRATALSRQPEPAAAQSTENATQSVADEARDARTLDTASRIARAQNLQSVS